MVDKQYIGALRAGLKPFAEAHKAAWGQLRPMFEVACEKVTLGDFHRADMLLDTSMPEKIDD